VPRTFRLRGAPGQRSLLRRFRRRAVSWAQSSGAGFWPSRRIGVQFRSLQIRVVASLAFRSAGKLQFSRRGPSGTLANSELGQRSRDRERPTSRQGELSLDCIGLARRMRSVIRRGSPFGRSADGLVKGCRSPWRKVVRCAYTAPAACKGKPGGWCVVERTTDPGLGLRSSLAGFGVFGVGAGFDSALRYPGERPKRPRVAIEVA
jgi:hypothetical protein